jgi:hypothetical protein
LPQEQPLEIARSQIDVHGSYRWAPDRDFCVHNFEIAVAPTICLAQKQNCSVQHTLTDKVFASKPAQSVHVYFRGTYPANNGIRDSISRMAQETRRRRHASYFDQADPSAHMLGVPKSRPRFRTWLLLAILTGTVLALALVLAGNLIF